MHEHELGVREWNLANRDLAIDILETQVLLLQPAAKCHSFRTLMIFITVQSKRQ